MHPRHAQAMLLAAAACLALIAYGFAEVSVPRTGDALWPWIFGIAATTCAAFAVRISSRTLYMASGLVVPLAFALKVAAVAVDLVAGDADAGRLLILLALWVLVGILAATTWVFVLGPVVSYTAQQRQSR